MSSVDIVHIEELRQIGIELQEYAQKIEQGLGLFHQKFSIKTSPDHMKGLAVQAYIDYINQIQTSIYQLFPQSVHDISQMILKYADEVSMLDFNQAVKTSDQSIIEVTEYVSGSSGSVRSEMFRLAGELEHIINEVSYKINQSNPSIELIKYDFPTFRLEAAIQLDDIS